MNTLSHVARTALRIRSLTRVQTRALATAGGQHVTYTLESGGVGVIVFDSPGVKENVLSRAATEDLVAAFDALSANTACTSMVVMSGKPNSFVAGADIKMLAACKTSEEVEAISRAGQTQFARMEASPKPIVAAIMGSCMGGGFELALACHYRIAVADAKTKIALPEVMLGLMPGAGGTQRMLANTSLQNALDVCMTGKQLIAVKAKKMGLVHQVVQPLGAGLTTASLATHAYLRSIAMDTARQLAAGTLKVGDKKSDMPAIVEALLRIGVVRDNLFLPMVKKAVNAQLAKMGNNYPAPVAIMNTLIEGYRKGAHAGYEMEARCFGQLAMTNECKALMSIFQDMARYQAAYPGPEFEPCQLLRDHANDSNKKFYPN